VLVYASGNVFANPQSVKVNDHCGGPRSSLVGKVLTHSDPISGDRKLRFKFIGEVGDWTGWSVSGKPTHVNQNHVNQEKLSPISCLLQWPPVTGHHIFWPHLSFEDHASEKPAASSILTLVTKTSCRSLRRWICYPSGLALARQFIPDRKWQYLQNLKLDNYLKDFIYLELEYHEECC
jgi:hypothetical protein